MARRRERSWIGVARNTGILFGMVAVILLGATGLGIVLREWPKPTGSGGAGLTIESIDPRIPRERVAGVVARVDGRPIALTTLSNIRHLATAGVSRVHLLPDAASSTDKPRAPIELDLDDCLVSREAIEQWIEGSPAGKGEDAWASVGRGSVIDLAWWPLPEHAELVALELGAAPSDGTELRAVARSGAALAAHSRVVSQPPAAMPLQSSAGSIVLDQGTAWMDADGALAAITVETPSIEERTRRGVAAPSTWSDLHAIPTESLRRLGDPRSMSAKPLVRVLEAAQARATQPAAAERAARLQWLIAASAAEGFAALSSTSDRAASLPSSATTIELLPRPVDGEARIIVWPELSDMVDLDVSSTDPAIRLVAVPGVKGRMLEVRDGGGQPAVLPAGRPVSISIEMSLMGKPIGGAVRAMLLGRDPDAAATQRRIPGGMQPAPAAPVVSPSATTPAPTTAPSPTPPASSPEAPQTTPAPSPPAPPSEPPAPPSEPPAPSSEPPAPSSEPPQPAQPANPGSTP